MFNFWLLRAYLAKLNEACWSSNNLRTGELKPDLNWVIQFIKVSALPKAWSTSSRKVSCLAMFNTASSFPSFGAWIANCFVTAKWCWHEFKTQPCPVTIDSFELGPPPSHCTTQEAAKLGHIYCKHIAKAWLDKIIKVWPKNEFLIVAKPNRLRGFIILALAAAVLRMTIVRTLQVETHTSTKWACPGPMIKKLSF